MCGMHVTYMQHTHTHATHEQIIINQQQNVGGAVSDSDTKDIRIVQVCTRLHEASVIATIQTAACGRCQSLHLTMPIWTPIRFIAIVMKD